ncbi:transposase [Gracilibacillus xinjiangensis]|uniref:Transposase n=1 Tax=Gracilibacillus xinjiangensis TaxID=1193282 RepID=A0ABV8X0B9_9BACI
MSYLLIAGSIVLPFVMFLARKKWDRIQIVYNVAALIALLLFGNLASVSIYQIIRDNTVFMTNIHGLFLNPFFLITGAYLGLYAIYQLINLSVKSV